jgi:tetratricopeptide (TPR) repeat protein
VQWSWDLLSEPERLLVERLAVFPAGATPGGAEAVCADDDVPAPDVLDLLASLVDKSLLQESGGPEVRYRMLETIREYGQERLGERGELARMRDRHARHYAHFVKDAEPRLRTADQLVWMARLHAERDNVLAALRHLGDRGDARAAVEMAVSMGWYWSLIGSHAEALTWVRFALDVPGEADTRTRLLGEAIQVMNTAASPMMVPVEDVEAGMTALTDLGARMDAVRADDRPLLALLKPVVAMFGNNPERVDQLITEGLSSPDPWVRAALGSFRAAMAENNGDIDTLRIWSERAVQDFRELGERWGLANSLQMLGQLRTVDGDLDAAIGCYEEGLRLVAEMGAREDMALMQVRLADLRLRRGDLDEAFDLLRRAQRMSEATGSVMESVFAGAVMAECARLVGDLPEARRLRDESLRRFEQIPPAHPIQGHGRALMLAMVAKQDLVDGAVDSAREHLAASRLAALGTRDMPIVASVGVGVADLAARLGRPRDAAEVLGAAAGIRGADDATNLDVRRVTAGLRETLGDAEFRRAYERGRALDREAALARLDPASL